MRSLKSSGLARCVVPGQSRAGARRCDRVVAKAAVQTPSSATADNMLHRITEHTHLLDDNPLDVISAPRDAESSAALVSFSLLSHILANTSAFYEFSARSVAVFFTMAASMPCFGPARTCTLKSSRPGLKAGQCGAVRACTRHLLAPAQRAGVPYLSTTRNLH